MKCFKNQKKVEESVLRKTDLTELKELREKLVVNKIKTLVTLSKIITSARSFTRSRNTNWRIIMHTHTKKCRFNGRFFS